MRRLSVLFLLAIAALLTLATPAFAHTELAQVSPAPRSAVKQAPGAVTLTFTQEVDPRLATVTVKDADGAVVSTGSPTRAGLALAQPLQDLEPGRYAVDWRAAAADGHILRGTFGFRVGGVGAGAPTVGETEKLSPAEMLLRHAKGDYNHKGKPSYAISAADRKNSRTAKADVAVDTAQGSSPADDAEVAATVPPTAPAPDNAGATIITLLAAALGVTTVTAVLESVRASRV